MLRRSGRMRPTSDIACGGAKRPPAEAAYAGRGLPVSDRQRDGESGDYRRAYRFESPFADCAGAVSRWWWTAKRASSRRFDTPSLSKMLVRWCFTVFTLIENFWAMSPFG